MYMLFDFADLKHFVVSLSRSLTECIQSRECKLKALYSSK